MGIRQVGIRRIDFIYSRDRSHPWASDRWVLGGGTSYTAGSDHIHRHQAGGYLEDRLHIQPGQITSMGIRQVGIRRRDFIYSRDRSCPWASGRWVLGGGLHIQPGQITSMGIRQVGIRRRSSYTARSDHIHRHQAGGY